MARYSRGILAMAISAVAFSVMAALVKIAGPHVPNQELVGLRGLASVLPIAALMWWRKVPLRLGRPGWLFVRGLFGYLAISCWFLSLQRLALPDSVMIQYTSPVFVALMAPIFLREPSLRRDRWALVIALLGVALVVRPGLGLTASGAGIGLLGALFSAGSYLTIRALRRSDHAFIVMLAFPTVASIMSALVIGVSTLLATFRVTAPANAFVWPDAREWALIGGIAGMTAVGQIFVTYGLHQEKAGPATVATYLAVVVSIPLGIALFGQWPDGWMLLGGTLVIGSVASLAFAGDRVVPPPAGAGASQVTIGLDSLPGRASPRIMASRRDGRVVEGGGLENR